MLSGKINPLIDDVNAEIVRLGNRNKKNFSSGSVYFIKNDCIFNIII